MRTLRRFLTLLLVALLALTATAYGAPGDQDDDGVADSSDNCSAIANPDQADRNLNGTGDACEDADKDGLTDRYELYTTYGSGTNLRRTNPDDDNTDDDGLKDGYEVNRTYGDPAAPRRTDPTLRDTDADGWEDGTEVWTGTDPTNPDTDGDGVRDSLDNCVKQPNPDQKDTDRDSRGDACDDPPPCDAACQAQETITNPPVPGTGGVVEEIIGQLPGADIRPVSDLNRMGSDGYVMKIIQSAPDYFTVQAFKDGVAQQFALPTLTTYSFDGPVGMFVWQNDDSPTEGNRIVARWRYNFRSKVLTVRVGKKQSYQNVALTFSAPVAGYPAAGQECRQTVLPGTTNTCDGFAVAFYNPAKSMQMLDLLDAVPYPTSIAA